MLTNRRRNIRNIRSLLLLREHRQILPYFPAIHEHQAHTTWFIRPNPMWGKSSLNLLVLITVCKKCYSLLKFCWRNNVSFGTVIGSSAANGRPSLMELPYLPPLFMTRSDQGGATDYSRPPPPGSQSSAGGPSPIPGNNSCFNCGASGHRGTQCQQITFDEIINPSPVWGQLSHYQTHNT